MIYYVEGCTCSGKTTFVKKAIENGTKLLWLKEEPPLFDAKENTCDRQLRIFNGFMESFKKADKSCYNYIADFSPLGCVPFSLAMAACTKDEDESVKMKKLAQIMLQKIKDDFPKKAIKIAYLSQCPNEILKRLTMRNRTHDNTWTPEFIRQLCYYYDQCFQETVSIKY